MTWLLTFKGNRIEAIGKFPKVSTQAPEFSLVNSDLSVLTLADLKGKRVIFTIFLVWIHLYAHGIVPVNSMLNMKLMAKALKVKKVAMADKMLVARTTGYVLGGVSPLGQKKRLKTAVDSSVKNYETVFVSAGRRGLEIELTPADLIKLTNAMVAGIAQ